MEQLSLTGEDLYELMADFFQEGLSYSMKIQCKGSSMSPFVKDGCNVTIGPRRPSKFKVGNIVVVAVHSAKRILVHRIIASTEGRYLLKGDNNFTQDGWFSSEDILAVVDCVEGINGREKKEVALKSRIIALASRTNVLQRCLLPGLRLCKRLLVRTGSFLPLAFGSKTGM